MEKNTEIFFADNDWHLIDNNKKVRKQFTFRSFTQAFSWMTEIAFEAEKLDHHPDWTNVYNKIDIILSTHDQNKITEKDLLLAEFMEKAFEKYS